MGDRLADAVALFAGSWRFLGLHVVWWGLWWLLRLDLNTLTMILSLEAIILTALVLMSQNRAADRDRAMARRQADEVEEIDQIEREDSHLIRDMHAMMTARHIAEPLEY